jgi:hypothetical protein
MADEEGILYVAFGKGYDAAAAQSAIQSRKVTSRRIVVISNVLEQDRSPAWRQVKDVWFETVQMPDDWNRLYKCDPYDYVPFVKTLYIDCDAYIASPYVSLAYDLLEQYDIAFPLERLAPDDKGNVERVYVRAAKMFGATLPLLIPQGGVCCFRKVPAVQMFFAKWRAAWIKFSEGPDGCGRDMPPLACIVQQEQVARFGWLPDHFGGSMNTHGSIVRHAFGPDGSQMAGYKKCPPAGLNRYAGTEKASETGLPFR